MASHLCQSLKQKTKRSLGHSFLPQILCMCPHPVSIISSALKVKVLAAQSRPTLRPHGLCIAHQVPLSQPYSKFLSCLPWTSVKATLLICSFCSESLLLEVNDLFSSPNTQSPSPAKLSELACWNPPISSLHLFSLKWWSQSVILVDFPLMLKFTLPFLLLLSIHAASLSESGLASGFTW